jgi:predicted anti-sigma-YlaC factor YlaD
MNRFCRQTRERLSDLMDGESLSWWSAFAARSHLALCPHCRRVERSLADTRDALRALKDLDPETDPTSGPR